MRNFAILCFLSAFVGVAIAISPNPLYSIKDVETDTPRFTIERLPNKVVPISYDLKIAPNLSNLNNFTYRGEVNITVHTTFTTDHIILHSLNLNLESITVNEVQGRSINVTVNQDNDMLIIKTFGEKLKFNKNYTVSIKFGAVIGYGDEYGSDGSKGFYRSSYAGSDGQRRHFVITQFEPRFARTAFPCFDEPRYRASFTISLARSADHIAVSNMPSEAILPPDSMSNGLKYEKFQTSPPMPTYLVAFMVSDFESLKSQDGRIRVIVKQNATQRSNYALQQAIKLMDYFEGHFGIPYHLPKVDVVGVPNFGGGMENWGMTTYDQDAVILEEDNIENRKDYITRIISHEFSHLWFGDLVTPGWYDYLWIKEGFATYFEFFGPAAIEPTWNEEYYFIAMVVQYALGKDNSKRAMTWPIRKPGNDEGATVGGSYDAISYQKAGAILRMFEHMISSNTFQNALHHYLKTGHELHKGVAVQKNVFDAFDKQVELDAVSHLPPHISASDIMKSWSENVGYPLINVARTYHTGEVTITQTPYPLTQNATTSTKWIVPLTFTTKSQQQFSNLLPVHWSIGSKPVQLNGIKFPDWIIFNLKQSGFYRVNYDLTNWQLLIRQLTDNHTKIDVSNRAQLIDDSFALTLDNVIPPFIPFYMVKSYLPNEDNIVPWWAASNRLLEILNFNNATFVEQCKKVLRVVLEKPINHFGCNVNPGDDHITILVKQVFTRLIIEVGVDKCKNELLLAYSGIYFISGTRTPPDARPAIFCNALRYAANSTEVSNDLLSLYNSTEKTSEKMQILESILSCARDETIIRNLLSKLREPEKKEISSQYISNILQNAISSVPAVNAVIGFIKDNVRFASSLNKQGRTFLKNLLLAIESKVKTEEQLAHLKTLQSQFRRLSQATYGEFTAITGALIIEAAVDIAQDTQAADRFSAAL